MTPGAWGGGGAEREAGRPACAASQAPSRGRERRFSRASRPLRGLGTAAAGLPASASPLRTGLPDPACAADLPGGTPDERAKTSPGLGATVTAAGYQTKSKLSIQLVQQGTETFPTLRNELNLGRAHTLLATCPSLCQGPKLRPDSAPRPGLATVKEQVLVCHPQLCTHTGPRNESGWDGPRVGRFPRSGQGAGAGRGRGACPGRRHSGGPPRAECRLGVVPALARPILSTGLPVAPVTPRPGGPGTKGSSGERGGREWTPDGGGPYVCRSQDDEDGRWQVHAGRSALAWTPGRSRAREASCLQGGLR